jgi:hypothetical protein
MDRGAAALHRRKEIEMKFLQGLVALVATIGLAATAQAADVVSFDITGFGFSMGHPNAAEGGTDDSAAEQINIPTLVMGSYQGSAGWNPLTAPSGTLANKNAGVVGFDFSYFGPVAGYTNADNLNDEAAPVFGAFPTPSADLTGGVLTANLEAWTAGWNGNQFNQGASGIVANDLGGGTYQLIWTSLIVGGPFNGQTGHWSLDVNSGYLIPEPISIALVGTALVGLVVLRRSVRRGGGWW